MRLLTKLLISIALALASVAAFAQPIPSVAVDPCLSTGPKTIISIAVSGVATTQVIALSGTTSIYVCGVFLFPTGTTPTTQFVYGTGANCGTGTVTLTGAMPGGGTTGIYMVFGNGGATILKTIAGQALCIAQTGTTPAAAGFLVAIQQ